MTARRAAPEATLQAAIVDGLRTILLPPALLIAFPAGGGGRMRGARLKTTGLTAGMPDLLLFYDRRAWGIEVKTPRGTLSPAQRDMHAALEQAGIPTAVVRSVDDAVRAVLQWGFPTRMTVTERDLFLRSAA